MTYIENKPVDAKAIADLRQTLGWNRMEDCYKNERMNSYFHIGAFDGDQLVGFVDTVSNSVTDAYIQDLMVHPDYQGNGIGTELISRAIEYLKKNHIFMISVLFDEKLKLFYKRFGFNDMLCGQLQTFDVD